MSDGRPRPLACAWTACRIRPLPCRRRREGHRATAAGRQFARWSGAVRIVRLDGQNVLIIDTKWKRITRTDDPKGGVSQADVYQMMAYSHLYDCKSVVLLYPHHRNLPPESILQRYSIARPDAQERLFVATLDVAGSQASQESALRRLVAKTYGKCWTPERAQASATPP